MGGRRYVVLCSFCRFRRLVAPHDTVEVIDRSEGCEWCADDGIYTRAMYVVDLQVTEPALNRDSGRDDG